MAKFVGKNTYFCVYGNRHSSRRKHRRKRKGIVSLRIQHRHEKGPFANSQARALLLSCSFVEGLASTACLSKGGFLRRGKMELGENTGKKNLLNRGG